MNLITASNYSIPIGDTTTFQALKQSLFAQLRETIEALQIPASDYLIGGESSSGQLCIDLDLSLWVVFSSERGERYNAAFFSNGFDAGNYFVWELMRGRQKLAPSVTVAL